MTSTIQLLTALGQALAAVSLYSAEHPMRQAAIARLLSALHTVLLDGHTLRLSFIDAEVVAGSRPVTDLRGWDWGARLSNAGIQRVEIAAAPLPTSNDVDDMLTEMRARLAAPSEPARPFTAGGIRLGPLAISSARDNSSVVVTSGVDAVQFTGLGAELDAIGYVHREVADGRDVPMAEVDAIVHGLALTLRPEQHVRLPLLDARTVDEYTSTHACNVAMLTIALSEALGLSDSDARAIGTAALLHDIGNVKLPKKVLTKRGKLSAADRGLMESHAAEGARILSARGLGNGLASTVAYEHHVWFNGQGGYPTFEFPRTTHYASRIVHVCDIYDALGSKRPWREAWNREQALAHIESVAGTEVDPSIANAFISMLNSATELRQTVDEIPAMLCS